MKLEWPTKCAPGGSEISQSLARGVDGLVRVKGGKLAEVTGYFDTAAVNALFCLTGNSIFIDRRGNYPVTEAEWFAHRRRR